MSQLKLRQKNLTSLLNASEHGLMTVKSNISPQKVDIDGICSKNNKYNNGRKSSMLVFHQKNSKTISIDKFSSSDKNTLTTKSSKTSEVVSTTKEPVSRGFWRDYSSELSKKLWLPRKIDLQDSDLTYLNGFSSNMEQTSFVTKRKTNNVKTNSQTTSCLLSQYLRPDITAEETTSPKVYCRKIRFYPDKDQKILFEKCFGATRYFHNKSLDWIKDNPNTSYSHITLRKNCLTSDKDLSLSDKWQSDIPYDTRQLALKQLASNMKTNFTLLRRKRISHFQMKYKAKRNTSQICHINKKAFNVNTMRMFPRRLKGKISLKRKRNMRRWKREIRSVECDFVVKREEDRYYLCIPQKCQEVVNNPKYDTVSLDPGVRTFQTIYSSEEVGKIGDGTSIGLLRLYERIDKLTGILKETDGRKRRNIKRRCISLRTKVRNIVTDLHWKTANYLCSTYKNILLPSFTVKSMIGRQDRNIPKSVVRRMVLLSHYKFKERLRYLCGKMGSNLYVVNEAYTSKTCGNCGCLGNVGSSAIFKCESCGVEIDRDYNGSRNILLKQLHPTGVDRRR